MARGRLAYAVAIALALVTQGMTTRVARADDSPSQMQRSSVFVKDSVVRVVGYWEVTYNLEGTELKEFVGGTGSGFFASADGFVVTNAHVVADIRDGEEVAKKTAFEQLAAKIQKEYGEELAKMSKEAQQALVEKILASAVAVSNHFIILPDGTKLDYEIRAFGKPGTGADVSVIKVEAKDLPNLPIADSDIVQVQDRVLAIGYPGAADMEGLLDAKSQLEATMNEGAVSALKHTAGGDPIIQISASITHGNSGGPTINEHGEVIGLSTFGSEGEVQGFNFLVASATVKKYLVEAKVDTALSSTTKAWRQGLEDYYSSYYDESINEFEEVLTLFPTHLEANRLARLARAAKKAGKGKPKPAQLATTETGSAAGPAVAGVGAGTGSTPKPSASMATTTTPVGDGSGAGTGIAVGLVLLGLTIGGVFIVKSRKRPPGARPAPGMHPPFGPGAPGQGPHPQAYPQGPGIPVHPQGPHAATPHHTPMNVAVPMMAHPQMPPPQGVQPHLAGRVGAHPVARTVAIQPGGSGGHAPVAATAFGSLSLGTITCTRGGLNGQRFALTAQGVLIGRQPGLAQIVIDDSRASGKHVWIGYDQGVLVAIDQGTTNGTFVNDVRFGRISKAPLKDGDTVIVSEPDCLSLTLKLS